MIKVKSEVQIDEIGGEDVSLENDKKLIIHSHQLNNKIDIEFPAFSKIPVFTVMAADLKAAICNALNKADYE